MLLVYSRADPKPGVLLVLSLCFLGGRVVHVTLIYSIYSIQKAVQTLSYSFLALNVETNFLFYKVTKLSLM